MIRKIIFYIMIVSLQATANHQKMNLQKALDLKLIKAEAHSLGGHQGFCMNINLKNLSNDSLIVVVEAGRRLNSIDDKQQDILITREEIIAMKKSESRSVNVKGYCCQASNHSPSTGAKYDINKLADSNLVTLARYLNAAKVEVNVEQQAIWAISDNQPAAQVASVTDSLLLPLKQLVANLKGEKLPWYSLISKTFLYQSGAMSNVPLYLRGKLEYNNDAESYTTLHVLNEKGIEVCQIVKQWTLAGANQKYNLNIPVKGLAKGKYTIELKTPEKQLAKQEFEI